MVEHLLELPIEMIRAVVKRVDYNGLLALREVSKLTKEIAEDECQMKSIPYIRISRWIGTKMYMKIVVHDSKPPISFLPYVKFAKVKRCDIDGEYHKQFKSRMFLDMTVPREQVSNFLQDFRNRIQKCSIDLFYLDWHESDTISQIYSFLEGLDVKYRYFDPTHLYKIPRAYTIDTIKNLNFNVAKLSSSAPDEERYEIADLVDTIITSYAVDSKETVTFIVKMLSKRCCYLHMPNVNLDGNEVDNLIDELLKVEKRMYLCVGVRLGTYGVTKEEARTFRIGSLRVRVAFKNDFPRLEIRTDGMERNDIFYYCGNCS